MRAQPQPHEAPAQEGLGLGGRGLVCALLRPGWRLARGHPFRIRSGPGGRVPASRDRSILCRDYLTPLISTFNPELVCASPARSLMSGPGFSAGSLHPGRIAEAPSSFSAPGLHANCVWEKFFNWQNEAEQTNCFTG